MNSTLNCGIRSPSNKNISSTNKAKLLVDRNRIPNFISLEKLFQNKFFKKVHLEGKEEQGKNKNKQRSLAKKVVKDFQKLVHDSN